MPRNYTSEIIGQALQNALSELGGAWGESITKNRAMEKQKQTLGDIMNAQESDFAPGLAPTQNQDFNAPVQFSNGKTQGPVSPFDPRQAARIAQLDPKYLAALQATQPTYSMGSPGASIIKNIPGQAPTVQGTLPSKTTPDTSVSPFEAWLEGYPKTSAGRSQAAREWTDLNLKGELQKKEAGVQPYMVQDMPYTDEKGVPRVGKFGYNKKTGTYELIKTDLTAPPKGTAGGAAAKLASGELESVKAMYDEWNRNLNASGKDWYARVLNKGANFLRMDTPEANAAGTLSGMRGIMGRRLIRVIGGERGVTTDRDAAAGEDMLPNPGDTEGTIANKRLAFTKLYEARKKASAEGYLGRIDPNTLDRTDSEGDGGETLNELDKIFGKKK